MAVTSTTWKKGQNPTRKKGQKGKATLVKEQIGLTGWEAFCQYIKTDGSDKLLEEMSKLSQKDYVIAFGQLAEYVKPKLNRTTVDGELNHKVTSTVLFQLDDKFTEDNLNNSGISKELSGPSI